VGALHARTIGPVGALDPDPFGQRRAPAVKRLTAAWTRWSPVISLAIVVAVGAGLIVLALVTGEVPEGG
jgi:hypothetical protein